MAFWKKSEDPWDIDPEKRRRQQEKAWKQAEERDLQGDEARQEEESFLDKVIFHLEPEREIGFIKVGKGIHGRGTSICKGPVRERMACLSVFRVSNSSSGK